MFLLLALRFRVPASGGMAFTLTLTLISSLPTRTVDGHGEFPLCVAQLSSYNPTCNAISPTSLSCPKGGSVESAQYTWLAADLASYKRTANSP